MHAARLFAQQFTDSIESAVYTGSASMTAEDKQREVETRIFQWLAGRLSDGVTEMELFELALQGVHLKGGGYRKQNVLGGNSPKAKRAAVTAVGTFAATAFKSLTTFAQAASSFIASLYRRKDIELLDCASTLVRTDLQNQVVDQVNRRLGECALAQKIAVKASTRKWDAGRNALLYDIDSNSRSGEPVPHQVHL